MTSQFIHVEKIEADFDLFLTLIEQWTQIESFPSAWRRATVGSGEHMDGRSNDVMDLQVVLENVEYLTHPVVKAFTSIHSIVDPLIVEYKTRHSVPLRFDNGWAVNRYKESQQYVPHYDWSPFESRSVSVVVMANSVDKGGQLVFPHQNVTIPAEEGIVAIFPSSFPFRHASLPVEEGMKYSLVTWLG